MTMTLHVPSDLADLIREKAASKGLDADTVALRALAEQFQPQGGAGNRATSSREAELLKRIRIDLPRETWERRRVLRDKFDDRTLSPAEHEELVRLNDEVENENARRLGVLVELAQLRNEPLEHVMRSLGVFPGSDDPTASPRHD